MIVALDLGGVFGGPRGGGSRWRHLLLEGPETDASEAFLSLP